MMSHERDLAAISIGIERDKLNNLKQMGLVSDAEAIAAETRLVKQEQALEMQELQSRLGTRADQIEIHWFHHSYHMLTLDNERTAVAHAADAPLLFALVVPLLLLILFAQLGDGSIDAKGIAMLGVLAAVIAALRPLGGGTAGLEPIWAILVLGGYALGPGFGFCLGAVSLFASALLTGGVGPWLPFQMLGAAWVGLGAGFLPRLSGRPELAVIAPTSGSIAPLPSLALSEQVPDFALGSAGLS